MVQEVNYEAQKIIQKINLDDRVQVLTKSPAFLTIKDHKDDFPKKVPCRLLNPSKSHLGKISKIYVENINKEIREALHLNQWRNTNSVINWFKNIQNKSNSSFVKFDIVSFYPSITLDLMMKTLDFARNYCDINDDIINTILNTRKSFLFYEGQPWVKKDTDSHFDVTEGSFDGAEICELIGLYILHKLNEVVKNGSVGLYRDDGLAVIHKFSGRQKDCLRKKIIKLFKDEGLQITIETNLQVVDFLDVQLDLPNNKFCPFQKPNNTPLYVHKESNHPPHVLTQIPKMTSTRLSNLSSDIVEFNKVATEYQKVINKSGFQDTLSYIPQQPKKKQRKRKILWYNPPFDLQVKTNIARKFLNLIDIHFPKKHKLHKIINRNTVKVSYSCMPNVASHISTHNVNVLQSYRSPPPALNTNMCNCKERSACPLNGQCQIAAVVYKGEIVCKDKDKDKDKIQQYVGLCEPTFKERYGDHKCSFEHKKYSNKTELSKAYWEIKDKGKNVDVKFSVLKRSVPYRAGTNKCNLCLWEKFFILKGGDSLINKRDELVSKCRHSNKFLLKIFKTKHK